MDRTANWLFAGFAILCAAYAVLLAAGGDTAEGLLWCAGGAGAGFVLWTWNYKTPIA